MSLPDEQPSEAAPRKRRMPTLSDGVMALLVVALIVGILELIPANYYAVLPGQAQPVEPMITIKGYPAPGARGQLYMTDVSLYKVDHLLEELYFRIDPNADLQPAQTFSGGLSENQYITLNDQLMTDSIHQAEAAALNATPGYHLQCSKQGPRVALTMPGTPAASRLKAGDVILSVNGHRVRCASEVSPLIKEMKPGQSVYMALIRRGQTLHIDVPTVPSTNGRPDKHGKTPLIGVYVQDQFVFPVKISINAGNIGGPSAGLMFSLGIVERLERRDLTHGCKIAGTGTISYNGAVGVIGGAKQKVIAAERAGAKYFFVPTGNVQEARSAHDGVTVVPIKTLEQAIQYLNHVKPCQ